MAKGHVGLAGRRDDRECMKSGQKSEQAGIVAYPPNTTHLASENPSQCRGTTNETGHVPFPFPAPLPITHFESKLSSFETEREVLRLPRTKPAVG